MLYFLSVIFNSMRVFLAYGLTHYLLNIPAEHR